MSSEPRLILASSSPRRRELLAGLGLEFEVRPVDVDETPLEGEAPEAFVERLAREKARARAEPDEAVLAADTIVTIDDRLLGKPRDDAEAAAMLRLLAGRSHRVLTGVALAVDGKEPTFAVARTEVRFAPLSEDEITWYVASGEPSDKAGAYAIQGLGALFVESIRGNYSNVVGLPLPTVYRLLLDAGIDLLAPGRRPARDAGTISRRP